MTSRTPPSKHCIWSVGWTPKRFLISRPWLTAAHRILLLATATCMLLWQSGCAPYGTPTPTAAPVMPTATASISAPQYPSLSPTPVRTPKVADQRYPAAYRPKDAFEVSYFPWAEPDAPPRYTGEGKAKVVNSVFFDEPPFFGFDIHPPEGWYHVVGVDSSAAMDGQLISPTINRQRQPDDGDLLILHGHIEGRLLTASYVGFNDGTFYYYRSLLSADELVLGLLPAAYDGLEVWVRGRLDVQRGSGAFYSLPDGVALPPSYMGREALLAGQIAIKEGATLEVTRGIFVKEGQHYVQIMEGIASVTYGSYHGLVRTLDVGKGQLVLEQTDDGTIEVDIGQAETIVFADGSPSSAEELAQNQIVEVFGAMSESGQLSARSVTIISATANGEVYAAYAAAPGKNLWSVSLDSAEQYQVTHLEDAASAAGLERAQLSPDGSMFVFANPRGTQTILVAGSLQTGEVAPLLAEDEWQETMPTWSPDARRLAFCRYRWQDGQLIDGGLWSLHLSSQHVTRLTEPASPGWQTVDPIWSPDGKHIAFGQASVDAAHTTNLYVLTLPADVRKVLENARDWCWSPDAAQLLFTRVESGQTAARLWVVQRDGESATWLSVDGVEDHSGRWSPDGTAIALLSRPLDGSTPRGLWIMHADGMRRAQPEGQPYASQVAWSADGQSILFIRVADDGSGLGLWLVSRDGSRLRRLAAEATELIGTYRSR